MTTDQSPHGAGKKLWELGQIDATAQVIREGRLLVVVSVEARDYR